MAIARRLTRLGAAPLAGLVSLAVLLPMAGPAGAQSPAPNAGLGTFEPPAGCSVFLTVQSRGCRVSNHYRCAADPAGDQWRADFDQEGIFFLSHTDFESQWVESYDFFPTDRQSLDPSPANPASFSELLGAGRDDFDFRLSKDTGDHSRVTGFDRLTGQRVTIDGVALQETEFVFQETTPEGELIRSAHGNEYISADWRLFFSGPSQWETSQGSFAEDGSPRQFIFPGEPGFAATEPIFDCDAVLSRSEGGATIQPAAVHK